jgi:fructosamine-3-kinase
VGAVERMVNLHREHNMPDVMVHGDLWANNVLLPKSSVPGEYVDSIAAVIDWQVNIASTNYLLI